MKKNRIIALILVLILVASFIFSACDNNHVPTPPDKPPVVEEPPQEDNISYSELNQAIVRIAAARVVRRLAEVEGAPDFIGKFEETAGDKVLDALKKAGITDDELTAIIAAVRKLVEKVGEDKEEEVEIEEESDVEGVEEEAKEEENDSKRGRFEKLKEIFENAEISEEKLVKVIYHIIRSFDDALGLAVFKGVITEREAVSLLAARDSIDKDMISAFINATGEETDNTFIIAKGKILHSAISADGGLTDEDLEKKVQKFVLKYDLEIGVDAEEMVEAMRNWAEYVSGYEYGEEISEIAFDSIFVKFVRDIKTAMRGINDESDNDRVPERGDEEEDQKHKQLLKGIEDWKEYPAVHMPKG